jgi:hypothetical protein
MTIFGAFNREICHEENPERQKLTKLIVSCQTWISKNRGKGNYFFVLPAELRV